MSFSAAIKWFSLVWLVLSTNALAAKPIAHDLNIIHPGEPNSRPIPVTLLQTLDAEGQPETYRMWVDSVICRDKVCEIVQVQLFWNALGQYQRYEVEPGEKLTKIKHIPFNKKDHAKLHRILQDKDSPLREVTKEGLTGPKANAGVDGVSGATVLTLKSTVVIGAGYTCYDLWHWANGAVSHIIQDLTGKTCSENKLNEYLKSGNDAAIRFALEHAKKRQVFDAATIAFVTASMKEADDELIGPALAYLQAATSNLKTYYDQVIKIFDTGSEAKRVFIMTELANASEAPPKTVCDQLSHTLPKFTSHHEVHLFLNLMEQCNPASETVAKHAAQLLLHKKFFIARRAFWYLEKQPLSDARQKEVNAFYTKHEDRL